VTAFKECACGMEHGRNARITKKTRWLHRSRNKPFGDCEPDLARRQSADAPGLPADSDLTRLWAIGVPEEDTFLTNANDLA